MSDPSSRNQLQRYYYSLESRIGYRLFLGGTRHFGYYDSKESSPFPIGKALRRMEDRLGDALQVKPGSVVLDAGCGIGHVAIRVVTTRDVSVDAIDIVEHHVKKARRNVQAKGLEKRISIEEGDYHDLSRFESNHFDAVYTMETFVHAHDPQRALSEFIRVLKPGGRLVMHEYEHVGSSNMPIRYRDEMAIMNKNAAMPGAQMFEEGVLGDLLVTGGFEAVTIEDLSSHILPLVWLFYIIAYIPHLLIRLFHLQSHFTNTMAAIQGYRLLERGYGRFLAISAIKPQRQLRSHILEEQTTSGADFS